VLVGASWNAQVEMRTLVDTTTGPSRRLGKRGAVVADDFVAPEGSDP
jgi:membrane protein